MVVVTVLVFSAVVPPGALAKTTNGGQTAAANVSASPGVHLPDATINDSTDSTVQVAYELPDGADPGNYSLSVSGPNSYYAQSGTSSFNGSVDSQNGTLEFTILSDTFYGGNHSLRASLVNTAAGESTTDTNNLTVTSPVTVANTSVESDVVYTNEQVNATATLSNPSGTAENYTVALYSQRGRALDSAVVEVPANGEVNTTVSTSYSYRGTNYPRVNDAPNASVVVEPSIQLVGSNLSTTDTYVGENVTANLTVENLGPATDTRNIYAHLYTESASQSVQLDSENKTNVSITLPANESGTWTFHAAGSGIGTVNVTNPVNATNVSFGQDSVGVGSPVTVTADVVNTADVNGTFPVALTDEYGQTVYGNTTVTLNESESATVQFNATFDTAGTHDAAVQNMTTRSPTVTNPVEVTSYNLSTNDTYVGENVTVTATVVNTGNSNGTYPVSVTQWSSVVATTSVTLNPGQSTTVTFNASFQSSVDSRTPVGLNNASLDDLRVRERIQAENITVSDGVAPGETVWVNVTYANPTNETASAYVQTDLNGNYNQITLAPGGTVDVNRSGSYDTPGEHFVFAHSTPVRVFVLNDTNGTANLTLDDSQVPPNAVVGDRVFVPLEVTNDGDAAGVRSYDVAVDGEHLTTTRVGVEPGESNYIWFETTFESTGNHTLTVSNETYEVTVMDPVVTNTSVSYVNGTEPTESPTVDARYNAYSGDIFALLTTSSGQYDLGDIGADESTRFRVNVTVRDYSPRVLLNTGNQTTWSTHNVSENETRVSILIRPSELNFKRGATSIENWDSQNDTADFALDAGAWMAIGNGNNSAYDAQPEALEGLTVSTDAQRFRQPRYVPGTNDTEPRIEVDLAAPHLTVDGEVNQGHYTAELPNSLLDEWNVSEPSDLAVRYTADDGDTEYVIEETDDGLRVTVSLHYSAGTVNISRNSTDTSSDDSTDDSTDYSEDDSTDDSTDESTEDTTDNTTTDNTTTDTTSTDNTTTNSTDDSSDDTESSDDDSDTETTTVTTTTEATTAETDTETRSTTAEPTTTESGGEETSTPGFGFLPALVALVSLLALARRRVGR